MRGDATRRRIFVFTGPDGSGRKTIADMAGSTLELKKVLSYTTRERRPAEQEGQDYYFVEKETFLAAERNGEFVESVSIDNHQYGIKQADIERLWAEHGFVYVILNPQGARLLKQRYGDAVVRVFLYTDRDNAERRQRARGDGEALIAHRMSHYDEAMSYLTECEYAFENVDIAHTVFAISNTLERYLNRQLLNLD
ncbi:guanylate kinase [Paenibacillus flagellatus]|uniref:Guanylate kinase n=1 Tax=Paenibacillus flagellatus TaxID=2211139 RepID=A0A2V5K881_9BACL|nr:guanylate kinase [Paenibacillus flagellatus]PYI49970.1 guanylate kinase [Paenibacillus flagellatus]